MEHHRLRKYRGPETWARVRAAYVAGESAPSVARRFDVGLSNLRRRALKEGWTRNRIAQALDLKPTRGEADGPGPGLEALGVAMDEDQAPVAPTEALTRAMGRAAWLLAEGRATEAMALMRAAETLSNLAGVGFPDPEREALFERALGRRGR